ncbi:hypothetical protein ACFLFF_27000 [Brevibacillus reuszeri]|uniref:hypothetical protein n=1 Tax=Brevibacillus reuszeri TaxID=54915 RepID=UPI00366BEC1A
MPFLDNYLVGGATSDVVKIAEVLLGSTALAISNIPQTYEHLRVIIVSRSDATATETSLLVRLNSNATNIYYPVDGTSATSYFSFSPIAGAKAEPNWFSFADITISNYSSTSMAKTVLAANLAKLSAASVGTAQLKGGIFGALDPITSLSLIIGGAFVPGSKMILYGIK